MISDGKKVLKRIYKGARRVIRIYKGTKLYYLLTLIEKEIKAIIYAFSGSNVNLMSKPESFKSNIDIESKPSVELTDKQQYIKIDTISFSGEQTEIDVDAVETVKVEETVESGTEALAVTNAVRAAHGTENYHNITDVTLTEQKSNFEAGKQQILLKDTAQAETGKILIHKAEQYFVITQKIPTANKGQVFSKPVKEDMEMFLSNTATSGAGAAKPLKQIVSSTFSQNRPELVTQRRMPEVGVVYTFFKDVVSFIAGTTQPHKAENKICIDAKTVEVNFGNSVEKPKEINLHITNSVNGGVGFAATHKAENHILITEKMPMADRGRALSKPVKENMRLYLAGTTTGGVGYSNPMKQNLYGIFIQSNPELLSQKMMPEVQAEKMLLKTTGGLYAGTVRPHYAENKIYTSVKGIEIAFGKKMPVDMDVNLHITDSVSGGVGSAKAHTAITDQFVSGNGKITNDTKDATAKAKAYSHNSALFGIAKGGAIQGADGSVSESCSGIDKTENSFNVNNSDSISSFDSKIYKPIKKFETQNVGAVSETRTVVYKPEQSFDVTMIVNSIEVARLSKIIFLSATTNAQMLTKAPLFKYIFLGATGTAISYSKVDAGETTDINTITNGILIHDATASMADKNVWHTQENNVLYIYQSNSAEQTDNVLTVDAKEVEAWHTQTDNVLFLNIASTSEQKNTQLEIDTLEHLPLEEWVVQTDNVLLINSIVDNTEIEVV